MALCDICNKSTKSSSLSLDDMRKAVFLKGFDPYKLKLVTMSNFIKRSEEEAYEDWKAKILEDDTPEWNICTECMYKLAPYLVKKKSKDTVEIPKAPADLKAEPNKIASKEQEEAAKSKEKIPKEKESKEKTFKQKESQETPLLFLDELPSVKPQETVEEGASDALTNDVSPVSLDDLLAGRGEKITGDVSPVSLDDLLSGREERNKESISKESIEDQEFLDIEKIRERTKFYDIPVIPRIRFITRLKAFAIDLAFGILTGYMLGIFFTGKISALVENSGRFFEFWIRVMLGLSFYFLCEAFTGYSLGKLIFKIRIGHQLGISAPIQNLIFRYILKNIPCILVILGLLTSFPFLINLSGILGIILFGGAFLALRADKQALHDYFVETAVFEKDKIIRDISEDLIPECPPPAVWLSGGLILLLAISYTFTHPKSFKENIISYIPKQTEIIFAVDTREAFSCPEFSKFLEDIEHDFSYYKYSRDINLDFRRNINNIVFILYDLDKEEPNYALILEGDFSPDRILKLAYQEMKEFKADWHRNFTIYKGLVSRKNFVISFLSIRWLIIGSETAVKDIMTLLSMEKQIGLSLQNGTKTLLYV